MNVSTTTDKPRGQRGGARSALTAAVIGFFVITLDAVAINVALHEIGQDLDATMTGLQWIVDGYVLLFAALLLSAGAFSDRIGARRAYVIGMAAFVVTSLACGLAPTAAVLIIARILQGAAAAIMLPASMALIGEGFPDPARRARAIGVWAMGGAMASISGPVLGGLLALIDWRMIFLINLPVGAIALIMVMRAQKSEHRAVPLDWAGQLTAVTATGSLVYATIEIGAAGITAPQTLIAFVLAVITTGLFFLSQHQGRHPVLPLPLLRDRTLAVGIVVGFSYMVGYFGLPFVMNLYAQQERGLSSFESGLTFVPMMVAGAVLTPLVARIAERLGARTLITTGMVLLAAGLAVLAALPSDAPVWTLATTMVLVGVAGPLVIPTLTSVLLNSFDITRAGTISGVFNTSRQIGGALAVATFGTLLVTSPSFYQGFVVSLLIAALIAAAAAVTAGSLLPRR